MEGVVLRICIRPLHGAFVAPGHYGYPRAPDLILGKGPERPLGSPDHGYDGETVSPSPQFNSQTSAGSSTFFGYARDQPRTSPSAGLNALILCDLWLDARFVAATLCQHSPGDPRQLIGECGCQDVMV